MAVKCAGWEEQISEKMGFGLMRLPLINDEFSRVDKKMLCNMVDFYLDKGFQYFDSLIENTRHLC